MECVHSAGDLSQHTAGGSYPLLKVVIKQSCCHFSLIVAVIMNNNSWQHLLICYNSCQSLCAVWLQWFCAFHRSAINCAYEFHVINSPDMGLLRYCANRRSHFFMVLPRCALAACTMKEKLRHWQLIARGKSARKIVKSSKSEKCKIKMTAVTTISQSKTEDCWIYCLDYTLLYSGHL